MEEFKFKQKFTPDIIFKAKKLYEPANIYVVVWEINGDFDCVGYPIEEVDFYIKNGSWKIIS